MLEFDKHSEEVNILGFESQVVSVVSIQLCYGSMKAAIDNMCTYGKGCVLTKLLFTKANGRLDLILKPHLLTLDLILIVLLLIVLKEF
jgi:hypothetical protein